MGKQNAFLAASLALTFLVLIPTLRNGWVTLDDPIYILENPLIRELSWENIKLMFATLQVNGSYNPLVLLSWAIDYHFVELSPTLYHVTNLVLHLIIVALVYYLSLGLSKNKWVAFGTSLLFGIHPMHVEAVAWVTARKDLLYTLFYIAGLIAYHYYQDKEQRSEKTKWILICFFLYVLSLFSKGSALTFPLILWAMDYLKRREGLKIILLEKIPFLLLSMLFTHVSIKAQDVGEALQFREFYSVFDSLSVGFFGYLDYLIKVFVPYRLSALHPYPTPSGTPVPLYFSLAAIPILGIVIYCLIKIKTHRVLNFGLGFFFISLIPVIQVLSFAISVTADRFTYLPYFGIFYMLSVGVVWLIKNKPKYRKVIVGGTATYVVILSIMTFSYSLVWNNSQTLWSQVLKFYPDCFIGYVNRSFYWLKHGESEKAIQDCDEAITVKPDYYLAYYNRGVAYKNLKKLDQAIADYTKAIAFKEDFFRAYQNRGILYVRLNELDLAHEDFNTSIEMQPDNAIAYLNRASIFEKKLAYTEAIIDATKAISIDPKLAKAYYLRGKCYQNLGKKELAIADYTQTILYNPSILQAFLRRGKLNFENKKYSVAINDFDRVIHSGTNLIEAYIFKSQILIESNRLDEALFNLNQAEKISQKNSLIHLSRSLVYQKKGDFKSALRSLEIGIELNPKDSTLIRRKELIAEKTNKSFE